MRTSTKFLQARDFISSPTFLLWLVLLLGRVST